MKELNLFIRPDKLESVKRILIDEFRCGGMTVLNVMGCGSQKGFTDEYTGVRTNVNLLPKIQVEVIVNDEDVNQIVDRICDETVTGHSGDGKIIVKDVCDVIRVRTKEHGKDAV